MRAATVLFAILGLFLGLILYPLLDFSLLPPVAVAAVATLPVAFWMFFAAGLIAWYRRPRNRLGMLLMWAGLTVWLIGAGNTVVPAFAAAGALFPSLVSAAVIHLLLAFPTGTLRSRAARLLVAGSYVTVTVLEAIEDIPVPAIAVGAEWVHVICATAISTGVCVVLVQRVVRWRDERRRTHLPVSVYGFVFMVFVTVLSWWWSDHAVLVGSIQILALAVMPIVILFAFLGGGFHRTAELEELGVWLTESQGSRTPIRAALSYALGDPSLVVHYRSAELQEWVDDDGAILTEQVAPGRARYEIVASGKPVARVEYDAELLADARIVAQAAGLVTLALDRERLTAELRASRQAVIDSRERLADAADHERRRMSRRLHDGLQARLLLIGIAAQRLAGEVGHVPAAQIASRATGLRDDVDRAADELRAMIEDLVPPALIELGVRGAVAELVSAMPIPTDFTADVTGAIGESSEMAAYFVVSESLSNVVKHSRARSAAVTLRVADGWVDVGVVDDGIGLSGSVKGSGLSGIADRVGAAGGVSAVESPPEGGTRVWARIPSGS